MSAQEKYATIQCTILLVPINSSYDQQVNNNNNNNDHNNNKNFQNNSINNVDKQDKQTNWKY